MTAAARYEEWLEGDALAVGRALMEPLPAPAQVARAIAVLEVCCARWPPIAEFQRVIEVGQDPARWREGKNAFGAVRALTLREERVHTHATYRALLYVAEIAAKITFNASTPRGGFDADSPWWLAKCARSVVASVGDDRLAQAVWAALTGARMEQPLTDPAALDGA